MWIARSGASKTRVCVLSNSVTLLCDAETKNYCNKQPCANKARVASLYCGSVDINPHRSRVIKIALNVLAAMCVGISMLLQDFFLAKKLGLGASQDAYQLSYVIVSNLWNVVSGGAILAVSIPMLSRLKVHISQSYARRCFFAFSLTYLLTISIICLLLGFFSHSIFSLLTTRGNGVDEAQNVFRLLILSVPLHLIATYFVSVVVLKELNFVATLSSALVFLTIPLYSTFFPLDIRVAAILVSVGVTLQLIFLSVVLFLRRDKSMLSVVLTNEPPVLVEVKNGLLEMSKIAASALLISLLNWLVVFDVSALGAGAVSRFVFAMKPANLIAAFLTVTFANQLLSSFSDLASKKHYEKLDRKVVTLFLRVLSASLLIVVTWYFCGHIFYALLFRDSNISGDQRQLVSQLSTVVMLQLPAYIVGVVAWRGLNALGRNYEILKACICALAGFFLMRKLFDYDGEYRAAAIYVAAYLPWALYLCISFKISIRRLTNNNRVLHE